MAAKGDFKECSICTSFQCNTCGLQKKGKKKYPLFIGGIIIVGLVIFFIMNKDITILESQSKSFDTIYENIENNFVYNDLYDVENQYIPVEGYGPLQEGNLTVIHRKTGDKHISGEEALYVGYNIGLFETTSPNPRYNYVMFSHSPDYVMDYEEEKLLEKDLYWYLSQIGMTKKGYDEFIKIAQKRAGDSVDGIGGVGIEADNYYIIITYEVEDNDINTKVYNIDYLSFMEELEDNNAINYKQVQ